MILLDVYLCANQFPMFFIQLLIYYTKLYIFLLLLYQVINL